MSRKLVIATGNKNKVREIKDLLKDLPFEVLSKDDIGLKDLETLEDGKTLAENSRKKALELASKTDYMVVADDSGLFVDALDGAPGIYSSRYGGEEGNDSLNNKKLLEELSNIYEEDRTARFKTIITLVLEDKDIIQVRGVCEGKIDFELSGDNGFGYDPLFIPEGYDKSFAELGDEIKNKISHRGRALEELKKTLKDLI